MNSPGSHFRVPRWTIFPAVLIAAGVLVWSFWQDWGAAQWSSLGTWVAGLATVVAVWVALWQSNRAAVEARQLHLDQLRHQHRAEQAQSLVRVWEAGGDVMALLPVVEVWLAEAYKESPPRRADQGPGATLLDWGMAMTRLEAAIAFAETVVTDEATYVELVEMRLALHDAVAATGRCRQLNDPDDEESVFAEFAKAVHAIHTHRLELGDVARERLSAVRAGE